MYRILVASDGSAPARRALAVAAEVARGRGGCRLHVLSVLEAVDEDVRRLIPAAEIERVLAAEAAESRAAADAWRRTSTRCRAIRPSVLSSTRARWRSTRP